MTAPETEAPAANVGQPDAAGRLRLALRPLRDLSPDAAELRRPGEYLAAARLARRLKQDDYTLLSNRCCRTLFHLAREVDRAGIPGALVDCGVWNGGSTVMLSAAAPDRTVWAFDSFEGLPEPGPEDSRQETAGHDLLVAPEHRLHEAFARHAHPNRLEVRKGWFDKTFPEAIADVGPIAVLHADGDWFDSINLTLESFYDSVSLGGFVVVDDYGHFEGARKAVDGFRAGRNIVAPIVPSGGVAAYWRKPPAS